MPRGKKTTLNKTANSEIKEKTLKKRTVRKKAKTDKPAKLVSAEFIEDLALNSQAQNSKSGAGQTKTVEKTVSKKSTRKTKAKPVLVNIIEDEDLNIDDDTFFSHDDLGTNNKENTINRSDKVQKDDFLEEYSDKLTENFSSQAEEIKKNFQKIKAENLDLADVDRQKQFFSDLVTEIKTKRETEIQNDEEEIVEKKIKHKKSLNLYRRLVWKFLILVGFLAVLVFYLSFSKLTIFITPKVEAMNDNLFLKVLGNEASITTISDGREKISGTINELDIEINKTYRSTGEEYIGEEVSGTVFLINNYTKDQSLVATTRLLTSDNKLFRIKEAVVIPAGGEIEVEIYADKISAEMAISPTRFIIPGLWAGLQDKIYAESREAFVYQQKAEKFVRASDIQLANQEVNGLLLERAKEFKTVRSQDQLLYKVVEPIEIILSAEVGDKVEEFTLNAKAKVVSVSFSQDEVSRLAIAKLNILVPDDKELADFKADNLTYTLENYDEKEQVATIKASFSGMMILKSNAEVIDRESLVNLSAEQISTYLQDYPEISSYELQFYPDFIKKAPHLVDRIQIKIKK